MLAKPYLRCRKSQKSSAVSIAAILHVRWGSSQTTSAASPRPGRLSEPPREKPPRNYRYNLRHGDSGSPWACGFLGALAASFGELRSSAPDRYRRKYLKSSSYPCDELRFAL